MSIQYVKENLFGHPQCVHGPTFLLTKTTEKEQIKFFACSACRDRKDCPFYLREGDKYNDELMKEKQLYFTEHINHDELNNTLNKVLKLSEEERKYCRCCNIFVVNDTKKHDGHEIVQRLTTERLSYPSTWLNPRDANKKEAQYLFSQSVVTTVVNMLKDQNLTNVLCIGTPRIHEHIRTKCHKMKSFLLDIDDRYHNFFKPHEFCWYNLFNNYFFKPDAKKYYIDFLKLDNGKNTVVLLDPPFGGRTEPISQTIDTINDENNKVNSSSRRLPIFFFMPYFMEPHIKNHIPDLQMADYMVDYDNHVSFSSNPRGRKQGSPVRIFTNVALSKLNFGSDEYRYCDLCEKYVYKENRHCDKCDACTSKDGRRYKHCDVCRRCVKPSWVHCVECKRCAQQGHQCGQVMFAQSCFHCYGKGHKRSECPTIKRKGNHKSQKHKKPKKTLS